MKKNKLIIGVIIIILLLSIPYFLYTVQLKTFKQEREKFEHITERDSSKYILFDGKKCYMLNDGGTHIEQYYEIDLINNIIEKKENYNCKNTHGDYGNGILSLYMQLKESYIGKTLEIKKINQNQNEDIKKLLDQIINKGEPIDYMQGHPNILKSSDKKVKASDEDFNKFLSLIE